VPFFAKGRRRYSDHVIATPQIEIATDREISTQMAFGKILDDLSKADSELAARIVTTSPDVTGTPISAPGSTGASCLPGRRGRHVQAQQYSLDREMGVHTRRPAYRARHCGNEPVPAAWVRPACRIPCSASG
jgi:hypothetical protein